MSRRIRNILLFALVVVAVWIVGYTIFHLGDYAPGEGEGDPVRVVTTP